MTNLCTVTKETLLNMKAIAILFLAASAIALSSCETFKKVFAGVKITACYEGVCTSVELPKTAPVTESGKEPVTVQPN